MRTTVVTLLSFLVLSVTAARGAEAPTEVRAEKSFKVKLAGEFVTYRATAGRCVLRDASGKPKALMFSVAYLEEAPDMDAARRPVTFAFNGGPGSSSVWLHMGGLGPRRVVMDAEGWLPKPPYRAVENPDCWLDFTDLVFIDPVSTGYSRAAEGVNAKEFHGLYEDAQSVANFIRQWLTTNDRWKSPIYLVGESYGTTRAAQLSSELAIRGIDLSGIVLISPILNFQTTDFAVGNDLPYWLYLPTLAATAHYHGMVPGETSLEDHLAAAEEFAETDYLLALAKGNRLDGEDRERMARRIAGFTGLDPQFVLQADLRVGAGEFRKELLRKKSGRTVGRLDSRFTGEDRTIIGSWPDSDPAMDAIRGPFTATLNDYLGREIGYRTDLVYEIMAHVHPWKMGRSENRYVNVAEALRRVLGSKPDMRVLLAMGYYDLATPYYAVEYTMSHLRPKTVKNVSFKYFESGHMMYIRDVDRAKLTSDVRAFYRAGEK